MSIFRKSKKSYCSNFDEKKIADNKTFWKTIKSFIFDKIVSREKVNLIKEDEIVKSKIHTSEILNISFCNIVSKLKIVEYAHCDYISDNINDLVIAKYRNHSGILKIAEVCNTKQCSLFSFSHVDKEEILK